MKPDNNAFAICGAILFAAFGLGLMLTGNPVVQQLTAVALWFGAASQWIAQDKNLWLASRICAYLGMAFVALALVGYLIR